MQFSAIVLMSLLTLTQVFLLPKWVSGDAVLDRARRLFSCATALLAVQFLLQYTLKLRALGSTQAVAVNLLLFIPCSCLFSLAIFCLQRRGKINRRDWLPWLLLWVFAIVVLTVAEFIDGQPLFTDPPELRWAEVTVSVGYAAVQCVFTYKSIHETRRIQRVLADYYDSEMGDMLHWMRTSILILAGIAVTVPLFIFSNGVFLAIYGIVFLSSICYLVFSFACYSASNNSRLLMEAERNASDTEEEKIKPIDSADYQRVEVAVQHWIEGGNHLRSGITVQEAADEMKVPRYLLTAWIKTTGQEMFGSWLSYLRVEEAKRLLSQHPEWSNDIIAENCGFTSRSYFQTVFKKQTGMTPSEFLKSIS